MNSFTNSFMSSFPMWRRRNVPIWGWQMGRVVTLWLKNFQFSGESNLQIEIFWKTESFGKLSCFGCSSTIWTWTHQPYWTWTRILGRGFIIYKSLFLMPLDSGEIGSWESTPGFDSLPSHREGPWAWLYFWPTPKCQRFTANIVSAEVRIIVWMKNR